MRDVYNERPVGEAAAAIEGGGGGAVGPAGRECWALEGQGSRGDACTGCLLHEAHRCPASRVPATAAAARLRAALMLLPASPCFLLLPPAPPPTTHHPPTTHPPHSHTHTAELPRGAVIHTNKGDIWLKLFSDEVRKRCGGTWIIGRTSRSNTAILKIAQHTQCF